MIMSFGLSYSQIIQSKKYNTTGYIKPDGIILDSNYLTAGFIKSEWNIQDKNHSTIGYIKSDRNIYASIKVVLEYSFI